MIKKNQKGKGGKESQQVSQKALPIQNVEDPEKGIWRKKKSIEQ